MKLKEAQEILNRHCKQINKKLRPKYKPESQATISQFVLFHEERDVLRVIMNVASCIKVNKKEEFTQKWSARKMRLGYLGIIGACEDAIKILDSLCKKKNE